MLFLQIGSIGKLSRNIRDGVPVCNMMYYIAQPDEYTYTFGEVLDPNIPVIWTGGDVVDNEITVEEVYLLASGIRRKPYITDNYPVNDFAVNRLFMGPLVGRPNDLVYHVYPGFLENPMPQEYASRIGLATCADYAWNPLNYDPERSWNAAIRLLSERCIDAVVFSARIIEVPLMEKRESIELATEDRFSWIHLKRTGGL